MTGWLDALERRARLRARAGLTRQLRPRGFDEETVDLAGNDYLGLARHPAVIAAATTALHRYGVGATGSRLVRGSTDLHASLETSLASWLGTEAALVYSSGYLANLGAVRALVQSSTVLASDAHNHASLIDGVRLSGTSPVITAHNDVSAVRAASPDLVVTESVFSVDGDLAPLADLHSVDALLLVDDAHALGVLGPAGAGGVAAAGLSGASDVIVTATLSKSLGAAGGVVAGPAAFIAHLVDTGRTFIYDTALPPSIAAAALAALDLARSGFGDAARAELAERAKLAHARLVDAGLESFPPAAGVVSVTAPGPVEAVEWAAACRELGVAVGCFRPPTTPDTRSRLRLTINVGVPRPDFERALDVILKTAPRTSVWP